MGAIIFVLLLSLVLIGVPVRATKHNVGGNSGWAPTTDLLGWASGRTFVIGETLVFNYGPNHGVSVVTKDDYKNCNTDNPISTYSGGKTTITLDKAGPTYFICPTPGHCQGGMKLSINVLASGGSHTDPHTGISPPSIPVIPVHGPQPITDSPPSPRGTPIGGFPSPIGGFPGMGGPYGWPYGQVPYHRGACGRLSGGLIFMFSLVFAALVGFCG